MLRHGFRQVVGVAARRATTVSRHSLGVVATRASFVPTHAPLVNVLSSKRFASTNSSNDDMVVEDVVENKTEAVHSGSEKAVGKAEHFHFQTETAELLELVAKSLYTDKEIFIRELISNSSDALEKLRFQEMQGGVTREQEPKILVSCDDKGTITIQDTGIGMTRDELISHLGTIARSGSKKFVQELQKTQQKGATADQIIGQFGVGFYSAFTVAKNVKVYTRSAKDGSKGYLWETDGAGDFSITEAEGVEQGTKIVITLRDTDVQFAQQFTVERIIKKYSSFVSHPIFLNNVKVNTSKALWRKNAKEVTETEHGEFFRQISKKQGDPLYTLHFHIDTPLSLNALFYVPGTHNEGWGPDRSEQNVSLYSRNVLIKAQAKNLLPDWLRFLHGVVDSEDIPLNVSREETQDSALLQRLNSVLTRKVLRWLKDMERQDSEKYGRFWKLYGSYLKEGAIQSFTSKAEIGPLLRFETTKTEANQTINLDTYLERMKEGQKYIYYTIATDRRSAEASPYLEEFNKRGVEVLILSPNPMDEVLMDNLGEFRQKQFKSVHGQDTHLNDIKIDSEASSTPEEMSDALATQLSEKQCKQFAHFLATALPEKVLEATPSTRLSNYPAVIVGHESATKRMYRMLIQQETSPPPLGKQRLEFNPKHPIVRKLYQLSLSADERPKARLLAEQLFDTACLSADLIQDPKAMVGRLNDIMKMALNDVPEPKKDE